MLRRKSDFFECVGVPGSGKTTYVDALVRNQAFVVPPAYVSRRYTWYFLWRYPYLSLRWFIVLMYETYKSRTYQLFLFKLSVFLNSAGRFMWSLEVFKKGGSVAVDEGPHQRVLSLYEREVGKENFLTWIRYLPHASTIVFVEGDALDAHKLGTKRKSLGAEYGQKWLKVVSNNARMFKAALEQNNKPFVCSKRKSAEAGAFA